MTYVHMPIPLLFLILLLEIVPIGLFSLQAWPSFPQMLAIWGIGSLIAGMAAFIGALIGFLFGVPHTQAYATNQNQGNKKEPKLGDDGKPLELQNNVNLSQDYIASTNLEQISDWLTKILVGVGLTQIGQVPGFLQALSTAITPALGNWSMSGIFGIAIILYGFADGFFIAFLWTRRWLILAYLTTERQKNILLNQIKADQNKIPE